MVQGVLRFGLGRLGWFASGGAGCMLWLGWVHGAWFLTKRLCAMGLGGREVFDQTSMRHGIGREGGF